MSCAILSPALMLNFFWLELTNKTFTSPLKSGSTTPAATSILFLRAKLLRGAMCPYRAGGMAIQKPRLTFLRDWGGMLVDTALYKS